MAQMPRFIERTSGRQKKSVRFGNQSVTQVCRWKCKKKRKYFTL